MAFSIHCSNDLAQEDRLPLLFALAIDKALINSPGSFIEVSCFGNNQPTRIRLGDKRPEEPGEERIEEESEANDSDTPQVCFGDDIFLKPLLKSDSRYCFSPDSGVEVKVYRRAASDDSADSEDSDSEDSGSEDSGSEDSGSEDSGTSYKNSDNHSDEDEADAESDVQHVNTSFNPFRGSNEISQYCATPALKKIKQEPVSDGETPTPKTHKQTHLPADQRARMYQCEHEGCNYRTKHRWHLNRHKQTHLPAYQRARMYHCEHEGCNYRTKHRWHLKRHKQTHLPADQRVKVYQCEHEGCNYRTEHTGHLRRHKQTHLPADQRAKMHQCGHEGCDYRSDRADDLKRHKRIHLPVDRKAKKPEVYLCNHEDCNYSTYRTNNMKVHKQTHLPADQRPGSVKRKAYDQPSFNEKRMKGDKE